MGFLNLALTQIVIVGCLAFLGPGLFNALGGLGKAGGDNATAGNIANAVLYGCFAIFGFTGGTVFNWLGQHSNRIMMCVGSACYATYTIFIYISGTASNADWLPILGGALLGIGAGWFWTAQGAMMLCYSNPDSRGKYIAIFWIIFNLGGLVGGVISAALNWNSDDEGRANAASYFTFTGLMLVASLASAFFLVTPSTVTREDGTKVELTPAGSAIKELKGALAVAKNKYCQLLTLYFIGTNWGYTYQFNYVNGSLFNIRTRGINSALYWGSEMFSAYCLGELLDSARLSPRKRALFGYGCTTLCYATAWTLGIVLQYTFEDKYDKDFPMIDPIDITNSSRCALPVITYVLYGIADASMQSFAYWIIGAVAGNDLSLLANFAGYYKGVQSAGACIAWSLDLSSSILYEHQMWLTLCIWAGGSFLAFFVARSVKDSSGSSVSEIAKRESAV